MANTKTIVIKYDLETESATMLHNAADDIECLSMLLSTMALQIAEQADERYSDIQKKKDMVDVSIEALRMFVYDLLDGVKQERCEEKK